MRLEYLVEAQYWYASTGSLSGMSAPVTFYFNTDPISSIFYDMESRSHCEYYPHNRTLPKGVFEDLRGMLNYTMTGTSPLWMLALCSYWNTRHDDY